MHHGCGDSLGEILYSYPLELNGHLRTCLGLLFWDRLGLNNRGFFLVMIAYVTGTLGAGKTFHTMRLVMEHIAKGGICVTNIECDRARVRKVIASKFKVWMEDDQLQTFDPEENTNWQTSIPWGEIEGDVLVAMDETHLFYNSRDWAETAKNNRELLRFLTQSRKAGVDVIWITQDGGNVDKQFRVLAEWEFAIVSTAHLPLGWLGMFPFRAYCVKKISAKQQFVVKKEWFLYDKWIKGTYRTQSMLDSYMRDMQSQVNRIPKRKLRKVGMFETLKIQVQDSFAAIKLKF